MTDDDRVENKIILCIEKDNCEEFAKAIAYCNWIHLINPIENKLLLVSIVKRNSLKIFSYLLQEFPDDVLNFKEPFTGNNLIHIALEYGNCHAVKDLLKAEPKNKNKCHILSTDVEGNNELHKWTMYHSSCENCLTELVTIHALTEPYFTNQNCKGNNPLHTAAIIGNVTTCALLMKYFTFDCTIVGENGNNLLHFAAKHNDIKLLQMFSNLKMNMSQKNQDKVTCLSIALACENFQIAEKLVDMGVRIAARDIFLVDSSTGISLNLAKKIKNKKFEQDANVNVQNKTTSGIVNFLSGTPTPTRCEKSNSNSNNNSNNIQMKFKSNKVLPRTNKPTLFQSKLMKNSFRQALFDPNSNNSNSTNKIEDVSISTSSMINRKQPQKIRSDSCSEIKPTCTQTIINPFICSEMKKSKKNEYTVHSDNLTSEFISTMLKGASRGNSNSHQCETETIAKNGNHVQLSLINYKYISSFSTLDITHVIEQEVLHKSDVCTVYKGTYLCLPVAIKVYDMSKLGEVDMKNIVGEINLLMSLRHPNIVTYIGTCTNCAQLLLVSEYMEKQSLKSLLEDKKTKMGILDKLRMCYEISLALYYLHARTPMVIHRDLKSSNILVDIYGRVKLCDFGLSTTLEHCKYQIPSSVSSTPDWMAPESLTDGIFTEKSDIYSFGILMWEIMMRDTIPYKKRPELDYILPDKESLKKRPYISNDITQDIRELIEAMWQGETQLRPDIAYIVHKLEELIRKAG